MSIAKAQRLGRRSPQDGSTMTAEQAADTLHGLVLEALGLCAQIDADWLELVELLLRDAANVLDDFH